MDERAIPLGQANGENVHGADAGRLCPERAQGFLMRVPTVGGKNDELAYAALFPGSQQVVHETVQRLAPHSGIAGVLDAGCTVDPIFHRRGTEDTELGGQVVRQALHEQGVGPHRQVRAVLFHRTDRNQQAGITGQNGPHINGSQMLESERSAGRRRVGHWDVLGLIGLAALAAWYGLPTTVAAVLTLLAAVLMLAAPVGRRPVALLVSLMLLAGGAGAFGTTSRVRAIESAWGTDTSGVRGRLIDDASAQLTRDLAEAVRVARTLADRAVMVEDTGRLETARRLAASVERQTLEHGVAVFRDGELWAWAGRHRLPAMPDGPELSARITPFYVVLEARRQHAGRLAVAQVTLAADSAVPERHDVLSDRFLASTSVALQFFPPGRGPQNLDVFDYCIPTCHDTEVTPDTLFGVRMVPPGQGPHKLEVEKRGRRRVAWALLGAALALIAVGHPVVRATVGLGLAVGLVFTPARDGWWSSGLLGSATYFSDLMGPLSASAGALAVTALAVMAVLVARWPHLRLRAPWSMMVGAIPVVMLPWIVEALARGITPPVAGPGMGQWLVWQGSLMLVGAALLLASALAMAGGVRAPRWMAWTAGAGALGVVVVGLLAWQPDGWPAWYRVAWIPVAILAIQPGPRRQVTVVVALVAGGLAAVMTWGAEADGRLKVAGRDAAGMRHVADPVALGLLGFLGNRLVNQPPPASAAGLYARWTRSALASDGYPASLALWRDGPLPEAHLALAELGVPLDSLLAAVQAARASGRPTFRAVSGAPATRYVLAVPWADGTAATVTLGPRSRAIPAHRVARFLRGDPVRSAPYTLTLSDPVHRADEESALAWQRVGAVVRGEDRINFPDGTRHLHVVVPLGTMPALPVRGMLVLLLNVLGLATFVVMVERLTGRGWSTWSWSLRGGAFRTRLTAALVVFFVVPTVAFALWTARRLDAEAERSRDLIIRQTLQDATGTAREFLQEPELLARAVLPDLGERLGADLLLFNAGLMLRTTPAVLGELGLVDAYLPPAVLQAMAGDDHIEVARNQTIGGRATRVGYRSLGGPIGLAGVLAAPRLSEDPDLVRSELDLMLALLLVTLAGLAVAVGLGSVAARALARPVNVLRDAALQVGSGGPPDPIGNVPTELQPVADALQRMAQDVERARAALEAQRARTAAVLRSVATGVLALDEHQRVIAANQRAEELLDEPVPLGADLMALGGTTWEPVWRWIATQTGQVDPPEPVEFTIGDREIRVQLALLSGPARGWVAAFDDTTDRTRSVRVLAWGELARQIAHEIKNPLTPIRLGVQHLRRAWTASPGDFWPTLDTTSQQILVEIERLDAVARAFSRFGAPPEAGGALELVDVAAAARDVAGLYALGGTPSVVVRGDGPVRGLTRRDEFKEVLVNLVDNARNAGAREVVIEAAPSGDRVQITIMDNGRGIAADDLVRIFEPRFSTTTSGAGLGLAIARRLVDSWGGTITAASVAGRTTLALELLT